MFFAEDCENPVERVQVEGGPIEEVSRQAHIKAYEDVSQQHRQVWRVVLLQICVVPREIAHHERNEKGYLHYQNSYDVRAHPLPGLPVQVERVDHVVHRVRLGGRIQQVGVLHHHQESEHDHHLASLLQLVVLLAINHPHHRQEEIGQTAQD